MLNRIKETAEFIQEFVAEPIRIGIVLGSGLGGFADEIEIIKSWDYSDLPNFPISTVEGHSGKLIIGKIDGNNVIALQGRFHYYEGYSLKEATFPIRVFKALGVEYLLLSNASGGLNPAQKVGDLMVLNDHMHLFTDNPLRGKNYAELGPRFPDMSEPYSNLLIDWVKEIDQQNKLNLHYGVYAGTPGPTYETKAEYKYFRIIGADAVGMSTTPETIVAIHAGMKVFGISVISDMGVEGQVVEISHEEVQEVASMAAPKLTLVFKELVKRISSN
ncbi:MAG: purine-nucleoside phosphorylase [Flavobacteriales bacterium]|nr:purine-nucleoside phosphorylase [Flavobacteriales bacterium]